MNDKLTNFNKLLDSIDTISAPPESSDMDMIEGGERGDEDGDEDFDSETLVLLKQEYERDPEGVLQHARAAMDSELTHAELRAHIGTLEYLVEQVAATPDTRLDQERTHEIIGRAKTRHVELLHDAGLLAPAAMGMTHGELPANWRSYIGNYTDSIDIDPPNWRFETVADAHRWFWHCARGFLKAKADRIRAPFVRHGDASSGSNFIYQDQSPSGPIRMTLFGDFGTGLYHSRYIARQIMHRDPARYVFHLGDVYYAGKSREFKDRFIPYIKPMMTQSRVFTLNANHEMYSNAKPYFRFLKNKRQSSIGPAQEQEGSYFAIRLPGYQVIGIDTASDSRGHFEDGRWNDPMLTLWLHDRLREGKDAGLVNILLSPNQPYNLGGEHTPLWNDLSEFIRRDWIQLWFWGNTHHCALYERTDTRKFVGSCLGHGGYPYRRTSCPSGSAGSLVRWVETRSRFPFPNVRTDMGLNGFAEIELHPDHVLLRYVDWMNREGPVVTLARGITGEFNIASVNDKPSADY